MKKAMLTMLALLMLVTGCAAGAEADMGELRAAMLGADASLPEMLSVSDKSENAEELFGYLSDMDYARVKEFFFDYSKSGSPEELAAIRLKSAADAEAAAASLKRHAESRAALYRQYSPKDAVLPENAVIFTKGDTAVMIICKDASAVRSAAQELLG